MRELIERLRKHETYGGDCKLIGAEDETIRDAIAALSSMEAGAVKRECATDACGKPATVHFERGGVGSDYCADCAAIIQGMTSPASPVTDERVEAVRTLRSYWMGQYFKGTTDADCEAIKASFTILETALAQPASGEGWTREDLAQGLAMIDGIELQDIKATVGPAEDANNWREYLGRADDLLAHLSRATSPREAEGEACAAPEQGGENVE